MREAASTTKKGATTTTALAALGIVFGDLGTSPLYTYQTIVSDVGGRPSVGDAVGLLPRRLDLARDYFYQILHPRHARG